jgi:NADH-quinone oxidoreductase subunit G
MREVDGDAQIGIVDRGNGSEIATFREEGVHSLLSGNLMDVCPVGAITTREYRFKSRPWDNPGVVDTICTFCSKGCNTSAWLKAKPEWARGSRLIRMTPRFNPEVNGYWMCDIGRFDYHWVEGPSRVRRPMARRGTALEHVSWHDLEPALRDAVKSASGLRFLVSAHASTEELFVLKQLVEGLEGSGGLGAVTIAWTRTEKAQPPGVKFVVPAVNAPNVNGARDLGYDVGAGNDGAPNLTAFREAVEGGAVAALYVIDPGPAGALGDTAWIVAARRSGALRTLIVQAVVTSELVEAADVVLPGAAFVEKHALYTNAEGRVQGASRAVAAPGDALEDWKILANVAQLAGLQLPYQSSQDVRRALAAAMPDTAYATAGQMTFTTEIPASNWLQASNPSERWKWDFMFHDLPPVKGHNVQMESDAAVAQFIPLKPVG